MMIDTTYLISSLSSSDIISCLPFLSSFSIATSVSIHSFDWPPNYDKTFLHPCSLFICSFFTTTNVAYDKMLLHFLSFFLYLSFYLFIFVALNTLIVFSMLRKTTAKTLHYIYPIRQTLFWSLSLSFCLFSLWIIILIHFLTADGGTKQISANTMTAFVYW